MASDEMPENAKNQKERYFGYTLAYDELHKRQVELQQQIAQQQALIHQQEIELNQTRKKIKEEQFAREKQIQSELDERINYLKERENTLTQKQHHMEETLYERIKEAEILKMRLTKEIHEREEAIQKAAEEVELEKTKYREENRRLIESKSQSYVNSALAGLELKENNFHTISKVWSAIGGTAIALGIIFATYSTYQSAESFHNGSGFSWSYFFFVTFRGLILVAMCIALARYSFIYSNSYMHESLKSGERRHAINFGKFYLEVYGADASWSQIKDAFQHWNISNKSAFSNAKSEDFDPKIMEKAVEIANILSKQDKNSNDAKDETKQNT